MSISVFQPVTLTALKDAMPSRSSYCLRTQLSELKNGATDDATTSAERGDGSPAPLASTAVTVKA